MSSKKKPANVSVEVLELRGRGHTKEKANSDDNEIIRVVRDDHGYPIVRFPKGYIPIGKNLAFKKNGSNPLNWDVITIKRVRKKKESICKSA